MDIKVGSLVKPISLHNPLVSGCCRYDYAIVVSVNPYVMVSEMADMKWQCEEIEDYKAFGTAPKEVIDKCMKRLS